MAADADTWIMFKAAIVIGFAVWTTVVAVNNIVGFRSAAAAIGRTMAMTPLNEPPAIASPLVGRALTSPRWSIAALIAILLVQIAAAGALGIGGFMLLAVNQLPSASVSGSSLALIGFTLLAGLWLAMMIGGLWFGYWIRQEGLQLTHIALLAITILAAGVACG